jgi:hypothetical protein
LIITLPIPGFVSVVGFAVLGFAGDGIHITPGIPPGRIRFALFLLGKLLIGNKFFHFSFSFQIFHQSIAEAKEKVKPPMLLFLTESRRLSGCRKDGVDDFGRNR